MKIFNQNVSPEELFEKIGDITQIIDFKYYKFIDGMSKGVRAIDVGTPSGLYFTILIDRAMDISKLSYNSIPLSWKSATKEASPIYYESCDSGFHRTFYGGLFTTCGLLNVGDPNIDQGEKLGQHGRISNLPAEKVYMNHTIEEDEITLRIKGCIREVTALGNKYELSRIISTPISKPIIIIEDTIQNLSYKKAPLQILYHFNIGYPLLDVFSKLLMPKAKTILSKKYRKENSLLDNFKTFSKPIVNYGDEVFLHDFEPDSKEYCNIAIINNNLLNNRGMGLWIRFEKDNLPYLVQWKHLEKGEYVIGLEPSNTFIRGRNEERKEGYLSFLEPREVKKFKIEIRILESKKQIEEFQKNYIIGRKK